MTSFKDYFQNFFIEKYSTTEKNATTKLCSENFLLYFLAHEFNLDSLLQCLSDASLRFEDADACIKLLEEHEQNLQIISNKDERQIIFELLKSTITHEIEKNEKEDDNKKKKEISRLERIVIWNFFDALIFEDRILDNSVSVRTNRKRTYEEISEDIESKYLSKDPSTDLTLNVEESKLYVRSALLKKNSPVFRTILMKKKKDGDGMEIDLIGKSVKDVITFLDFLKFGNCFKSK